MEMRLAATSVGLSKATKLNTFGISLCSGVTLQTRIGKCTTSYVLSKPYAIGTGSAGALGLTVFGTEWFNVSNPNGQMPFGGLGSLDHQFVQLDISAVYGSGNVDVKLVVYKNDEPFLSYERINVPAKGFNTSLFRMRGRIKRANTQYKITRQKK